jgi:hypothetical protein
LPLTAGITLDGHTRLLHIDRMNQKQAQDPSSPPARRLPAFFYLVAVLFTAVIMIFWRNQSAMKSNLQTLSERNAALEQQLTSTESQLEQIRSTESARDERPAAPVAEPPVQLETIILRTPTVKETPAGLTARLEFQPDAAQGPLDMVALVVRIPSGSDVRIVAFGPVDEGDYSDIRTRVAQEGKFAIFQGTPDALKKLRFDLTVSGPVTATVRGSKGIRAFEITVDPANAVVRPL